MATSSVQWQCTKTLPECLLCMFEEEIACDVTFLVGKDAQEVKAHKVILMSRSPVFFSMLEGPLAEKGEITISDIDKDSFVEFLRYLYTDIFKPNSYTVMAVLYCAKKYCVDNLSKACADFLRKNISPENVCTIFEAAHRLDDKDIRDSCISIFKDSTEECLKSLDFVSLSKECLAAVLDLQNMNCSEEKIYRGVMRWAEEECKRQEKSDTPENCREILGDQIYKIRFATMDPVYFTKNIADSGLLSSEEKNDIFKVFILKDDSTLSKFISSKRSYELYKVNRFSGLQGHWASTGSLDLISFEVSHNAILHGVQVYGSSSEQSTISYSISINDASGDTLYSKMHKKSTDERSVMYDILLTKMLRIGRRKRFTIQILQKPDPFRSMYFGTNGQKSVKYGGDKTIYFFSATGSLHTNENAGQIPGLILS